MRRAVISVAATATLAGSLLVAARWDEPAATALTNCSTNSAKMNDDEQEFLRLLNEERARRGAPALRPSPTLNRAAAWKSEDSSAVPPLFDHVDSLGRMPSDRAQDCGYPTWVGENVAYGYGSPASVFNAWMNSPGHRDNMLNRNFRVAGVGQNGSAWTLKLGVVDDSGLPPPTPTPRTPTTTPTPTTSPTTVVPTPTATHTTVVPTPTATATATPTRAPSQLWHRVRLPGIARD